MSFLMFSFLLFVKSIGWGLEGHSMIAYAAHKLLSNKTKMNMLPLLGDYKLYEIAPLPDHYCYIEGGLWSKDLHYITSKKYPFDVERDCAKGCVYGAILNYTKRLNPNNSVCVPSFKPEPGNNPEPCNLEFLAHFVGDIHQPLHMSFDFIYPKGGNNILVNATFSKWHPEGIPTNLHACWDKWMIYEHIWRTYGRKYLDWMKWGEDLTIELLKDEKKLFNEYTTEMNPLVWVNGSQVMCLFSDIGKFKWVPGGISTIDETYFQLNIPHIKVQLMKSIARLAKLLDELLGF